MNQPNAAPELLPCPFCGAQAEAYHAGERKPFNDGSIAGEVVIDCSECDCNVGEYTTYEVAARIWNTRATPLAPDYTESMGPDELERQIARAVLAEEKLHDYAEVLEALEWYSHKAQLCRLIHSGGDVGRHALSSDGGERGRKALAAIKGRVG